MIAALSPLLARCNPIPARPVQIQNRDFDLPILPRVNRFHSVLQPRIGKTSAMTTLTTAKEPSLPAAEGQFRLFSVFTMLCVSACTVEFSGRISAHFHGSISAALKSLSDSQSGGKNGAENPCAEIDPQIRVK